MQAILISRHTLTTLAFAITSCFATLVVDPESTHAQTPVQRATQSPATLQRDPYGALPSSYKRMWYGWQTLIGFGVSILVPIGLIAVPGAEYAIIPVGIAGQMLSPPIIHWAHGDIKKGFASLGLTAALPLVLGTTGMLVACADHATVAFCGEGTELSQWMFGAGIGLTAGFIVGTGIDVAILAYKEPTLEKATNVMVLPTFDPHTKRAMLHLGMTF